MTADDHAPTEVREPTVPQAGDWSVYPDDPRSYKPRWPLPPAPARHLPVAQPASRYSTGTVVVPERTALFHSAPTTIEAARPHPVDVRPVRRSTSHRAPRTKSHVWSEYWFGVLMGFGLGVIAGVLGAALFTWWTS